LLLPELGEWLGGRTRINGGRLTGVNKWPAEDLLKCGLLLEAGARIARSRIASGLATGP
jgi:hypothetical protein